VHASVKFYLACTCFETKKIKMKKSLIVPLLSWLITLSCSNDKSLTFDSYKDLKTIIIVDDLPVRIPGDFIITDSCFIIINPFGSDYVLKAYSVENGEFLFDFVKKGNGPFEIAAPSTIHYNDFINVFDIATQKIVSYDFTCHNATQAHLKEIQLQSDLFADKLLLYDSLNALVLSTNLPGIVSKISLNSYENSSVVANPFSEYDNSEIGQQLNGTIKFDPYGNYLAFAIYNTPYYSLQRIENGKFVELASGFLKEPEYIVSGEKFQWIKELTPNGFMDIALLPDRLFLLHADIPLKDAESRSIEAIPDIIYELDYRGRLMTHYALDIRVLRLASGKNGKLYGIAFDQKDDKFKIVELPV